MAVSYGGAVKATAPAIVDTNASQSFGGATQGIGLVPADEADIAGWRIGAAAVTDEIVGEVGDGVGV